MKVPLSIVIPVYNAAPWLCQCLDSLRSQTFSNWEAILIDDGSTDASSEICKEYAARDKRFSYFRHSYNRGVVSARRSGVQNAVGEMVGFLDADDWLEPDMYQEMITAADNGEAVVCGYFRHRGGVVECPSIFPGDGVYYGLSYENLILAEMLCNKERSAFDRTPTLWNMILPRELVGQVFEKMDKGMARGEDALCVYTCLLQMKSLACIKQPLYHYRVHGNSVMGREGFGDYNATLLFYRQLRKSLEHLRPKSLSQADSLFLYLISLGAYENPALLDYSEVKKLLWKERLIGSCLEWKNRILRMRIKSLFAPKSGTEKKMEDSI